MSLRRVPMVLAFCGLVLPFSAAPLPAQEPPARPNVRPPVEVVSPEVSSDRKITLRIQAAKAETVQLSSSDLPGVGRGTALKSNANGIWEVTVGPVEPGAYRYAFNVDGVTVVDPRNPATSESNSTTWSLVLVPGSEQMDLKDVPHGAIAEVTYHSTSLKRFRRMHVYTPPGYESGSGKYPVFYLLHGAFDCDDSWNSVGRAGVILDNLIAAGQSRPMIVVMPTGHTGPFRFGQPGNNPLDRQVDEFSTDFVTDLRPFIERTYRVHADAAHRAIAGLSMGGAQTLNIAVPNLTDYAYIGVFSSGVFGIAGGGFTPPGPSWEERNQKSLDSVEARRGVKLLWFATGKDDFLLQTTKATVDAFKKHGFDVVFKETSGGHTWLNWRQYLIEFAPMLFH